MIEVFVTARFTEAPRSLKLPIGLDWMDFIEMLHNMLDLRRIRAVYRIAEDFKTRILSVADIVAGDVLYVKPFVPKLKINGEVVHPVVLFERGIKRVKAIEVAASV